MFFFPPLQDGKLCFTTYFSLSSISEKIAIFCHILHNAFILPPYLCLRINLSHTTMKKQCIALLITLCSTFTFAQTYCSTAAFGYGNQATGGGNATPTLVSSVSELQSALTTSGSMVIIITQNLTFTSCLKIKAVNKTLLALPGVKLTSLKQDKEYSGILYFQDGSKNLILRNLTFVGPGAYDCNGYDNLCFDGVTNAWVDHCDFQDGCDGNFDNKGNTDNITVSWCRFRYLKSPKSGGSGGTDDHRFSNLIGSGSSDKPSDGTYNMTWAYCWWDEGCVERMTRCRNASLHFLNCYWNSSDANYYVGPENADCLFSACTFEGAPKTAKIFYQNYGGTNGAKFVNCTATKGLPSNVTDRTVATPSYSFTPLTAADAKSAVTNSSCGAGATLTVTTAGAVSSSCDSGDVTPDPVDPDPVDPDPVEPATSDTVIVSTFWNFSDSDLNGLGTITAETTVRKLHLLATSEKQMSVGESSNTIDGITFTHCLRLGGGGGADYRQLFFSVKGDCTIDIYLVSSSSTSERTLNFCTGTFGDNIVSLPAAVDIAKQTQVYTGDATTIYLYSAGSGINIYGVRVTYTNPETALPETHTSTETHQRYNLLGLPVDDSYNGWVIINGKKYYQQ